ncbi:MAG: hypothetical protein LW809_03460 [Vampirovibrionales bacterium]|jgi:hypothetical protein|nr:hypothetical protein [Vampirovibrionales bacterium]
MSKKKDKFSISISIAANEIEGAVYSHDRQEVIKSVVHKMPMGVLVSGGDVIADANLLSELLALMMKDLEAHTRKVHLSIPCTLLRLMELPKMEREEYYVFLASEAERFRAFDNTEAVVAFEEIGDAVNVANQKLIYSAVRKDTFLRYQKAAADAKIQLLSIEVEPIQVIRSMIATGIMSSIAEQAEDTSFCWGSMMHEFDRLRFFIWRGRNLIDIREITLSGQVLANANENPVVLSDLVNELHRTVVAVKPFEPLFWFAHRLNYVLLQHLQHEIGVNFRSFEVPNSLQVDRADIGVVAVGGCFIELEPQPYSLNFLDKRSPYNKSKSSFSFESFSASSLQGVDFKNNLLMTLVLPCILGSCAIVGIAWLTTMSINTSNEHQQQEAAKNKVQLEASIARLKDQIDYYERSNQLSAKILLIANESKGVNNILLGLLNDIQNLPPSLWFSEVGYDKNISITGNAIRHEDILDLTNQLEERHYGQNFVLHYIREEEVSSEKPLIYSFMLGGLLDTTNLAKTKVKQQEKKLVEGLEASPEENKSKQDEKSNAPKPETASQSTKTEQTEDLTN